SSRGTQNSVVVILNLLPLMAESEYPANPENPGCGVNGCSAWERSIAQSAWFSRFAGGPSTGCGVAEAVGALVSATRAAVTTAAAVAASRRRIIGSLPVDGPGLGEWPAVYDPAPRGHIPSAFQPGLVGQGRHLTTTPGRQPTTRPTDRDRNAVRARRGAPARLLSACD